MTKERKTELQETSCTGWSARDCFQVEVSWVENFKNKNSNRLHHILQINIAENLVFF